MADCPSLYVSLSVRLGLAAGAAPAFQRRGLGTQTHKGEAGQASFRRSGGGMAVAPFAGLSSTPRLPDPEERTLGSLLVGGFLKLASHIFFREVRGDDAYKVCMEGGGRAGSRGYDAVKPWGFLQRQRPKTETPQSGCAPARRPGRGV